jgi:A/G-specific adenine glycosylase
MNAKLWNQLIHWSESLHNDLPWRVERSLYGTLVSEIMLQQTTVATVRNKFPGFIKKFPTLKTLAQATDDDIAIEWKGLGYYRRARNLKKAAEYFLSFHNGEIPSDMEALKNAPGVGIYTANAIRGIGYNQKALAIDANIERVLSRLFRLEEMKGAALQRKIEHLFQEDKIAKGIENFRGLNEALMDLGRVYCQARTAHCQNCPMVKKCAAFANNVSLELPRQEKKLKVSHELELVRFVVMEKGQFLGYRKTENQWLSGQVELPTFVIDCTDAQFNQYPRPSFALDKDLKKLPTLKTAITKYAIKNKILTISKSDFKRLLGKQASMFDFFSCNERKENLAATTIKILKKVS